MAITDIQQLLGSAPEWYVRWDAATAETHGEVDLIVFWALLSGNKIMPMISSGKEIVPATDISDNFTIEHPYQNTIIFGAPQP